MSTEPRSPLNLDGNWPSDLDLGYKTAKSLISGGHPRLAYDLIRDGLKSFPDDSRLTYLSALALTRGRNVRAAERTISDLLSRADLPVAVRSDSLSLQGRLAKEHCRIAGDSARRDLARSSATAYEQAYAVNPSFFPAINAATMWRIEGNALRSKDLANKVLDLIGDVGETSGGEHDYWTLATVGEASLLLGRFDDARQFYARAIELAGNKVGDIASMKQQVRLMQGSVPGAEQVLDLFQTGTVVVFSGHLIDSPDRAARGRPPRFPPDLQLEELVREQIRSRLRAWNCRIGYSSAACGSDLLFAEEALARGMDLHIVLPFALEDFYKTSVDFGHSAMISWRSRCDAVLAAATHVSYATREPYLGDNLLFQFANQVLQGAAITGAAEIDTQAIALVVLAREEGLIGGTREFVQSWQELGREVDIISLIPLAAKQETFSTLTPAIECLSVERAHSNQEAPRDDSTIAQSTLTDERRELKSMLFADVKGFSKLREEQTPVFFLHFLNLVAECLKTTGVAPIFRNTWGDGLFLVFEEPAACAEIAVTLCERIEKMDFATFGLPADLMARIGIHIGPVYRHLDPILLKENFFGSHVNRTARIEPVTMPGCVYASEQMASILAVSASEQFRCEYVGREDLAKSYDKCSLYHVVRAAT